MNRRQTLLVQGAAAEIRRAWRNTPEAGADGDDNINFDVLKTRWDLIGQAFAPLISLTDDGSNDHHTSIINPAINTSPDDADEVLNYFWKCYVQARATEKSSVVIPKEILNKVLPYALTNAGIDLKENRDLSQDFSLICSCLVVRREDTGIKHFWKEGSLPPIIIDHPDSEAGFSGTSKP